MKLLNSEMKCMTQKEIDAIKAYVRAEIQALKESDDNVIITKWDVIKRMELALSLLDEFDGERE